MFFSESVISRVGQFRMCTFPQRILECCQAPVKGTPECQDSCGKKKWCRNDKNGPLENLHFVLENTGSRPRMCGILGARVPFSECPVFPGELGSHRAASLYPPGEGQTFGECGLFSRKKGNPPGRDLRGTCEGTDFGEDR